MAQIQDPAPYVFVCEPDPERHPQDLLMLRAAQWLHLATEMQIVHVHAIGTTHEASGHARRALNRLSEVPVDDRYSTLHRALEAASQPLNLVITGPCSDVLRLAQATPGLIGEKISRVTILAGRRAMEMLFDDERQRDESALLGLLRQRNAPGASVIHARTSLAHITPMTTLDEVGRWSSDPISVAFIARLFLHAQQLWRSVGSPRPDRDQVRAFGRDSKWFLNALVAREHRKEAARLTWRDPIGSLLAGVSIDAMVALVEALRAARGEPDLFAIHGHRHRHGLMKCIPGSEALRARVVGQVDALVYRALLDVDMESRRVAIERMVLEHAGALTEHPSSPTVIVDVTCRRVDVVYEHPLEPATVLQRQAALTQELYRVLGVTPALTVGPTAHPEGPTTEGT